MLLFTSPQNYSEMLKKIASTIFIITFILILILANTINEIDIFMKSISFNKEFELFGIDLYISYLYFPFLFAFLEYMLKLHDLISTLLGIRYKFDKNIIIKTFLEKLNLQNKFEKITKNNYKMIMRDIFYAYASSTNPRIDRHLIDMAMGAWSLYWIFLDTIVCIIVLWIFSLSFSLTFLSLSYIFIIIPLIIGMHIIKKTQCEKYAISEVNEILKRNKKVIKGYLKNAL